MLSKVTHITQTIRITRRPGEEGGEEEKITFSAEPEELEIEEMMDEEQHEDEEGKMLEIIIKIIFIYWL